MTEAEEKEMAGLRENLWASKRRFKETIEAMSQKHCLDMNTYHRQVEALFREKVRLQRQVDYLTEAVDRNEGRRIFQVCLRFGAKPGNVNLWLQDKLEKIQKLEQQVSDAGWDAENRRIADLDRDVEGWK